MKCREKLEYIVLGGVLMLVGLMTANLTPLTAQKGVNDKAAFGTIAYTGPKVVTPEETRLAFEESDRNGGHIAVYDKGRIYHALIYVTEQVGVVNVYN